MSDPKHPGTPKDSHYARLRRAHRDRVEPNEPPARPRRPLVAGETPPDDVVRLYGLHTVRAALDNPRRTILNLRVTRNAAERLGLGDLSALGFPAEIVEPRAIDRITGSEAVHQGVLIEARPLRPKRLGELTETPLVVVLDQVTDPHNVGAIMRSAVAFGAGALVATARHSPHESSVLAKSASGALEHLDLIEVKNLAAALEELHAVGFHSVGLDSDAPAELESSFAGNRVAIVLGAEGRGLREKTRRTVSAFARLALPGAITSLNVSNAAAVSLYAARRYLDASLGEYITKS